MTDKKHEADLERVSQQNFLTDFTRGVEERPAFDPLSRLMRTAVESTPVGQALQGRTNFENHSLNAMVDLVEQTDPEDLESSGKALWSARDAIKDAAKELDGHIERVHWVGESGEAFRKWGRSLVTDTYALSDFAGGAGDQITAAAVGLADVRKAMPPRDTRTEAMRPGQFPKDERVESNDEYTAALKVEKNRQEAINQMNRLSSYYAVSQEQLAALEPPKFKAMPDVGVPKPKEGGYRGPGSPETPIYGTIQETATGEVARHRPAVAVEAHAAPQSMRGLAVPGDVTTDKSVDLGASVGTTIDSVGTLPPPTTAAAGQTTPIGVPGAAGGAANPATNGFGAPLPPVLSGRSDGRSSGARPSLPVAAQGRAGAVRGSASGVTPGHTAAGAPLGQVGRAAAAGVTAAQGRTSAAGPLPMGPGVSGGTPRAGGAATPRAMGNTVTGAGSTGGVVGGRPSPVAGSPVRGGQRIPPGTVAGAETTSGSRPAAGRLGQSGVFGADAAPARSGSSTVNGRGGSAVPGIVGNPAGRQSASNATRNGMTQGGTGLVRGPGGRGRPGDARRAERTQRPSRVAGDEETSEAGKPRHDAPPVN
ncbi:WXG100 family type VII secretion target [Streptomyces sp. AC558_RSS880]|uniref:WXG100 family type VII secretion target n=1 Tax=Streptomyces sp. AC558_RSS880 TaxID=2823687 RepID=UPI001C248210|nr:WXG100 family type VII secretion target [Streptomyces sp. AC558_RSS880]